MCALLQRTGAPVQAQGQMLAAAVPEPQMLGQPGQPGLPLQQALPEVVLEVVPEAALAEHVRPEPVQAAGNADRQQRGTQLGPEGGLRALWGVWGEAWGQARGAGGVAGVPAGVLGEPVGAWGAQPGEASGRCTALEGGMGAWGACAAWERPEPGEVLPPLQEGGGVGWGGGWQPSSA